ncbi:MAG: U32 family peptidase [Lentisphaeria bacterium]|nr:U32 family peptidase [Lentisphaeria bacterium]
MAVGDKKIELMAPAGDFTSLAAALRSGASSIYIGVGAFNMRSHASANFQQSDLKKVVEMCHRCGKKLYLTLNTIAFDDEIESIHSLCDEAKSVGVDAVIAADLAVITYANSIGLPIHMSVQTNVSNIEAVKFFAKFAEVVVLARECSLAQIKEICRKIKEENIIGSTGKLMEVEVFVHGALCVATSGRCFMSQISCNASANRGRCFQPCRRKYVIKDVESDTEFTLEGQYVMSPKDLCMIQFLEELVASGVSILKIEGRGRSADYVSKVVGVYREALDKIENGIALTDEDKQFYVSELEKVFNRKFWHGGYYLGENLDEWCNIGGSNAKFHKICVGKVSKYFNKIQVAEITLDAGSFTEGDTLLVIGPTTGALEFTAENIVVHGVKTQKAEQKSLVTLQVPAKVRVNDLVYLLEKRTFGDGKN